MTSSKQSVKWALMLISPFVLAFVLFWLLPLVYGIVVSLFDWNVASGDHEFVGFGNYKALLTPGTLYNDLFTHTLKKIRCGSC